MMAMILLIIQKKARKGSVGADCDVISQERVLHSWKKCENLKSKQGHKKHYKFHRRGTWPLFVGIERGTLGCFNKN